MSVPPATFYQQTLAEQTDRARSLRRRYDRLALLRLVLFVAGVAGLIVLWTTDWRFGLGATLLLLPVVNWGVRRHLAIGRAADHAEERARLAAAEERALAHDFAGWDDGAEFADPGHPYATDLDIYGPHSLFQFVNRTVTAPGREELAGHLAGPASAAEIDRRRALGRQLAAHPAWCHDFRALGRGLDDRSEQRRRLLEWVDRPAVVTDPLVRLMGWLAPLLTLLGLWWCLTQQPWQLGLLAFLPAAYLLRKYGGVAAEEHRFTASAGRVLAQYADLLAHTGRRPGADPGTATAASTALRRLAYRISQLDVRHNAFVILLEISGLWSLQWLRQLDRWRATHRADLADWLHTLADTDAAVSWANLRFNHPDWTDPEFTDRPTLHAEGLGHPLLPPTGRVTNDLTMATDGHIHLVTGSNMAGKSTWLRTVGINLVLARSGSPVCARHLRTVALDVWTSMRTQDDLSESTSSFYAELRRLKAIIEAVSDPEQRVFFLLDEILKGTNSRDRHTGARALIRQLIRERGAGIIATHDLELAALAGEPGSRVENFAMEVQTRDGRLVFDYRLHPGVSRSFNATALMAEMGIDIDPEDIRLHHD